VSTVATLEAYNTLFRTSFDTDLVRTVELFAGEFDEDNITSTSYQSPAIFTGFLASRPLVAAHDGMRYDENSYRMARLVAVVVVKDASTRVKRKLVALALAEQLLQLIEKAHLKNDCNAPEMLEEARNAVLENRFSTSADKKKQAIMALNWWVPVLKNTEPDPVLFDWLLADIDDQPNNNADNPRTHIDMLS
jgi:phage gp37-like protein